MRAKRVAFCRVPSGHFEIRTKIWFHFLLSVQAIPLTNVPVCVCHDSARRGQQLSPPVDERGVFLTPVAAEDISVVYVRNILVVSVQKFQYNVVKFMDP